MKEYTNYSLLPYNTFGIDVKAASFIEYSSVEDLKNILSRDAFVSRPFLHIGGGSNLLFTTDYAGTILHSQMKGMEVVAEEGDSVYIRVSSGVVWDDFVAYCVSQGWGGAENLSLIPGEVGASAVQNIGAYGVEAKDLISQVETVEVATGSDRTFTNEDCCFSYRQSIFKNELKGRYIVTYVTYRLSKNPVFNLEYGNIRAELGKYGEVNLYTIRQSLIAIREDKLPDPKVEGNAGSFFMNPIIPRAQFEALQKVYEKMPFYVVDEERIKVPAGWMIDQCGWKGKVLGRVGVHNKQALVLVNKGGATGQDVIELSKAVQAAVKDKFGIEIRPEVNFI
ncbi:UDP-N-acetylmuramate dehydrogenase [Phocaeicola sp.]